MATFMPFLSYDLHPSPPPSSASPSPQPQLPQDPHIINELVADVSTSASACDQREMAGSSSNPSPKPCASAVTTSRKSSSAKLPVQSDKQKHKRSKKKSIQRESELMDTSTFSENPASLELDDLAKASKQKRMAENEVPKQARHYTYSDKALKKAVYDVQMALFEGVGNEAQLRAASALLIAAEYQDIVTERSISMVCGFPLCEKTLQSSGTHKARYRISLQEHKVYDMQERALFCSSECLIASKTYSTTLQADREVTVEPEKLEEIISGVRGMRLSQNMSACTALKEPDAAHLNVQEKNHLIFEDFETTGPADAIEGYVPQRFLARGFADSHKVQEGVPHFVEIDNPSKIKLKSALKGAQKKEGVHVSWASDHDMVSTSKDDKLGLPDVAKMEPKNPDALTTHMLDPASVKCTECLLDGGPSGTKSEMDAPDVSGQMIESNTDTDTSVKDRLASAEELACALADAAAATEAGEVEPSEAVSKYGISILSGFKDVTVPATIHEIVEETSVGKHRAAPEWLHEDDLQSSDSLSTWYDAPPRGFKLELSMFGTIWMTLEEWISAATIAYIYGRENEGQEMFLTCNGREYKLQIVLDGISAEISRTLASCISRVLPEVVQSLHLSVPVSVLEQSMGRLLRSMSFVEALPALNTKQWRMVVSLFLDALSVQCLPALGAQIGNNRALLRKVISSSGLSDAEYETYKDLILPLGRLPSFTTMSGG